MVYAARTVQVLINLAAFHDKYHPPDRRNVLQRIPVDADDVGLHWPGASDPILSCIPMDSAASEVAATIAEMASWPPFRTRTMV
jgi:hypothetical protein